MYRVRKVFRFEGSHALSSAYSKECTKIHGHSYVIEVFLESELLDASGMIVDFKFLKERINHVFELWDHKLVVSREEAGVRDDLFDIADFDVPFNPTAENMARYFYDECKKWFIAISKVRVHETATGYGEYYE